MAEFNASLKDTILNNKEIIPEENILEVKIRNLLNKAIHSHLGITVPEISADITDRLKKTPLIELIVDSSLPFKRAKQIFRKQYIKQLLRETAGNIGETALKAGINRRSIHRIIVQLQINPNDFRNNIAQQSYARETTVTHLIEKVSETYKPVLNIKRFEQLYKSAPMLSREIVKELPNSTFSLEQAEQEFERRYFEKLSIETNNHIGKIAKKSGLAYAVVIRKIKSLGLRK